MLGAPDAHSSWCLLEAVWAIWWWVTKWHPPVFWVRFSHQSFFPATRSLKAARESRLLDLESANEKACEEIVARGTRRQA